MHGSGHRLCKRLGKQKQGEPRPILIRFNKEGKRNSILYNRANINKNKKANAPLLWINDDVSEETRRHRKAVRDIATLANQLGTASVKVHGDGLILNNNKYKHEDLDLLPTELSIAKAKSRVEETGIYFQGPSSPFSNMYQARFTDGEGQAYESVEQAYQHKKALFHDRTLVANKILATRNPMKIKKLSKQIPTNKNWLKKEDQIMEDLVRSKFTQNEELTYTLVKTDGLQLHEATSDKKWGTGAELSSKTLLNGLWEGQDHLGQLIEKIRNELIDAGFTAPDETEDPSYSESQVDDEEDNDISPIPDDEYDNENENETEKKETEMVIEADESNVHENITSRTKGKGKGKGKSEIAGSSNPRGNQRVQDTEQHGNTADKKGQAKNQKAELPLSSPQGRRTTSTSSAAASDVSATSPVSTHSLIHSLTRKNKRAAPPPPGPSAAPPLRGNRTTRTSQKAASDNKGKN